MITQLLEHNDAYTPAPKKEAYSFKLAFLLAI